MIERSLFAEEHDIWRATVRRFVEDEIVPIMPNGSTTASFRANYG
jgi:hypothetical protein